MSINKDDTWISKEAALLLTKENLSEGEVILLQQRLGWGSLSEYDPTVCYSKDYLCSNVVRMAQIEPHHRVLIPNGEIGAFLQYLPNHKNVVTIVRNKIAKRIINIAYPDVKVYYKSKGFPLEPETSFLTNDLKFDRIISFLQAEALVSCRVKPLLQCLVPEGRACLVHYSNYLNERGIKTLYKTALLRSVLILPEYAYDFSEHRVLISLWVKNPENLVYKVDAKKFLHPKYVCPKLGMYLRHINELPWNSRGNPNESSNSNELQNAVKSFCNSSYLEIEYCLKRSADDQPEDLPSGNTKVRRVLRRRTAKPKP